MKLPESGQAKETILQQLKDMKMEDANWRDGKTFSYVYYAGEDVLELTKAAYEMYFSENALNPTAFQSLRRMETEVIKMAADLFGGDQQIRGSLTSGGTESILMAVKTARSWALQNRPEIEQPEIILAANAHPAFNKACHYFKVKAVVVAVDANFRADLQQMRAAIGPNTVMLVASAPAYPQGGIDSVVDIAQMAKANGLLCHVDACVGGFLLPFLRQIRPQLPAFDFSVDGVTSISADIHKYGYAAKGA
ncbi:MAG: aminotransferase class V-fold PLP-dependent enzyme, partial [Bacteroidota bacterium]